MIYAFIEDRCGDLPAAVACRSMKVSTSGFYEWRHHRSHPRPRIAEDHLVTAKIREIHQMSRGTYGSPRVHAELRLGEGIRCSRKRVERLMRQGQIVGLNKRRKKGTTRRDPTPPGNRGKVKPSRGAEVALGGRFALYSRS
jgi:transposase InsO family protein